MDTMVRAKLTSRFFATFIDYALFFLLFFIFGYLFGEPNNNGVYSLSGLLALVPFIFWFIYFIVMESVFSATLGHILFNLKVVGDDNGRISFIEVFIRHIIDPMDFCFFGIPAIICITHTPLNQRLGDLVAKTIVIIDKEN
jgi:uncharacterized RDD family membrane protein YckC